MVKTGLTQQMLHGSIGNEAENGEANSDGTQDIRIAALFAILFTGLLGGLPPLYLKVFRTPGAPIPRLLRAMSAGIILALACIHIIPDSNADLRQLSDLLDPPYDVSGCTIVFGVLIMVVLQSIAHSHVGSASVANTGGMGGLTSLFNGPGFGSELKHNYSAPARVKQRLHSAHKHSHGMVAEGRQHSRRNSSSHQHHPSSALEELLMEPHAHDSDSQPLHGDYEQHDHVHEAQHGPQRAHAHHHAQPMVMMSAAPGHDTMDPHGHGCARTNHMAMQAAAISSSSLRQQAMAMMFELGCIFHSFIIGLTLGVETKDRKAVIGLTVALCFHQWLEGIALGGFIINAGLSAWKGLTMIVVYSLTCPIGVAVGVGIANSYDPSSVTALAVQGVLNGVSGGMLLYVALVMIIAEDFTRQDTLDGHTHPSTLSHTSHSRSHTDLHYPPSPHSWPPVVVEGLGLEPSKRTPSWLYPACHVALVVGAAVMALLAVWA
ncbi:Zinc/iron permease [Haematococcus lacustris]